WDRHEAADRAGVSLEPRPDLPLELALEHEERIRVVVVDVRVRPARPGRIDGLGEHELGSGDLDLEAGADRLAPAGRGHVHRRDGSATPASPRAARPESALITRSRLGAVDRAGQ